MADGIYFPQILGVTPPRTFDPVAAFTGGQQAQLGLEQQRQQMQQQAAMDPLQQQYIQAQTGLAHSETLHNLALTAQGRTGDMKPMSDIGKMLWDRQFFASQLGENSPQVKAIDSWVQSQQGQEQLKALSPEEKAVAAAEGQNWVKSQQTAVDRAKEATSAQQYIGDFVNAYNKLGPWERGTFARGYIGYLSSEGQLAQKAQNLLTAEILKMIKWGRITNRELALCQKSTLNIHMNPGAIQTLAPELHALFTRQQEYPRFLAALKNAGVTDTSIARSLWTEYTHQHPMITEDNQIHMENLPKWRNFITPEAIQAAKEGRTYFSPEFMQSVRETARLHGLTPAEVIRHLGMIRGGL
jgi:hypothetical protein